MRVHCGLPDHLWKQSHGYAVLDAMVALMIIAGSIVFSLEALHSARKSADRAIERRSAAGLLTQLLQASPDRFEGQAGRNEDFSWSTTLGATGGERPIEVCRHAVTLTGERSGRTFTASTLTTCPSVQP